MPELPEVETVRRMLERHVSGRSVAWVRLSGARLRSPIPRNLSRRLRGRAVMGTRRHGKYLFVDFEGGLTLVSHLGMSGRWLFFTTATTEEMPHVHARIGFQDGSSLWFQDPRRFGLLKLVPSSRLYREPSLALLGPDPVVSPPSGEGLFRLARGARVSVKNFLLDQRRLAGIGNIYASEILHRAGVDPRRRAGAIRRREWNAIAAHTPAVLHDAIDRMGTTFSMYRTLWNEPGTYGDRLLVYDRANQPCRRCGTPIRRIVQGQRSTFFCPTCQKATRARPAGRSTERLPARRG